MIATHHWLDGCDPPHPQHEGPCCDSCLDEDENGVAEMRPRCCCRSRVPFADLDAAADLCHHPAAYPAVPR